MIPYQKFMKGYKNLLNPKLGWKNLTFGRFFPLCFYNNLDLTLRREIFSLLLSSPLVSRGSVEKGVSLKPPQSKGKGNSKFAIPYPNSYVINSVWGSWKYERNGGRNIHVYKRFLRNLNIDFKILYKIAMFD